MKPSYKPILKLFCLLGAGTSLAVLSIQSVLAQGSGSAPSETSSPTLFFILAFIMAILGLLHINRALVRTQNKLIAARKELQSQIEERTQSLRATNEQLNHEIRLNESTELLLREAQADLQNIIDSMPSILIGISPRELITHWNRAAVQATGIEEEQAVGHPLREIYRNFPADWSLLEKATKQRQVQYCESMKLPGSNPAKFCDLTIYPLGESASDGTVIRIDDVTRRAELEGQIIQNEKLRSLGELAAGVAHEINNPLSAVIQGTQNIQRRLSPELAANRDAAAKSEIQLTALAQYLEEREVLKFLDNIRDAGERAASIVKNMLDFSRYSSQHHTPVDLAALIEHSLELSQALFKLDSPRWHAIDVTTDIDPDLPKVNCCAPEIQQVLLNLLRNASQALSSDLDQRTALPKITVSLKQQDQWAVISLIDNGPGLDPNTRAQLFDPFFTTKEAGEGTGLGLSVSHSIITERHHGSIEANNRPEGGSEFRVLLPLHSQSE